MITAYQDLQQPQLRISHRNTNRQILNNLVIDYLTTCESTCKKRRKYYNKSSANLLHLQDAISNRYGTKTSGEIARLVLMHKNNLQNILPKSNSIYFNSADKKLNNLIQFATQCCGLKKIHQL